VRVSHTQNPLFTQCVCNENTVSPPVIDVGDNRVDGAEGGVIPIPTDPPVPTVSPAPSDAPTPLNCDQPTHFQDIPGFPLQSCQSSSTCDGGNGECCVAEYCFCKVPNHGIGEVCVV
jgi:hypothetical protein